MLRDAAISLSLANICFVKVWSKALSGAGSYFNEFPIAYAGIIGDVLLLAVLFFVAITIVRRQRRPSLMLLARGAFLVAVLTTLNGIAGLALTLSAINFSLMMGRNTAYFAGLGLTAALVFLAIRTRARIIHFAPRVILALLPFVVITLSQAVWKLTRDVGVVHAENKPVATVSVNRKKPATRVLWIIFDEMDQRMSFGARPAGIELPELDRLRGQSVYAVNAYPPAPLTYMSLPALITGRLVEKVTPVRADELMIKFAGQQDAVGWSTQPNVFSAARDSGFNTGLAGWCHPYCEVIGASLSKCDEVKESNGEEITLPASMFSQAEGLIGTVPLVQQTTIPIIQRVDFVNQIVTGGERRKYTVRYKHVLEGALKAAVDPDLDLVFVHSPAPHPPGIYDRDKNEFSLASHNGYIDNLELVDRTVGDLRRAMEAAGVWESTTVIISADHWWRTEMWSRGPFWTREDAAVSHGKMDHRIPFLVKLAGQREQITYTPGFNTVVTHDLVLALMRGEVTSPGAVAGWLDQHRAISDSPYNRDELLP
jgi:Sulfatase